MPATWRVPHIVRKNIRDLALVRKNTYGKYLRALMIAVDWMLVNVVFGVLLAIYPSLTSQTSVLRELWVLVNVSFVPVIIWSSRENHRLRAIQIDRAFLHSLGSVGVHALFFLSLNGFIGITAMGEREYLTYYAMLATAFALWSVFGHWAIKRYRRRGYNYIRVIIIGTNETSDRLYRAMSSDSGFGYRVLGFFDRYPRPGFKGNYLGGFDGIDEFVKENSVDQIYFTMPGNDEALSDVVRIADNNVAEFFYVPQISHYVSRGFELHNIGSVPVLTVRRNPLKNPVNSMVKRGFDLAFSSLFLLFYPLIYIPIAIAIKITSPGPVYFKQQRTGYKGQPFECLKFRTMHVNVDADSLQATANDPRKTRLGDFLRRTSLDELPQFINVWKGDMSVVGPRPHMLKHTEDYSKLVDRYMVRHLIKPGITGWAQVNGYRGQTDELWKMEKRVQYDVWYIENWTLALDLKIIARTVANAVQGESNAF